MSFESLFKKKKIKKTYHYFPLKDSTFRNKDLIKGINVIVSGNMTMSTMTEKFEKNLRKRFFYAKLDIYRKLNSHN